MNTDANIAADLTIVSGQQKLMVSLSFFYQDLMDDLCWHVSYERCEKMLSTWVKLLYSPEKVKNYCTNY